MANGQGLAATSDARLTLTTLGGASLALALDGTPPVTLLGPGKPLALITYLAFSPRRSASREHLVGVLWADSEPDRAHHALRQTVWQIRHAVGERVLVTRNGDLVLDPHVAADRDAFLAAVEKGDLEFAVALYTGEFLPDFAAPGGAEFEQWADLERIRLRTAFLRCAESLARRHLALGHVREAQRVARRARDADRLSENGWRLLLETLVAGNEWTQAAMEADALERLLQSEEREPEPATRAAIRRARQAPADTTPGARAALVAELVGREKEFAAVLAAWDDAKRGTARHVHVTAPAGLGKTRLLQDTLARLRAAGARACYARANPGERAIPFAAAAECAAHLAALPGAAGVSTGTAAALVALNPSLTARFPSVTPERRGGEKLLHRTTALAELLAAVADEGPVAVLLDDLHWADAESRQVLAGVAAHLGGHRVLLVTAARPSAERIFDAAPDTLRLAPLDERQVAALVTSIAALPDESWARDLPTRLAWAAGGSPLLLLESLQLALEREALAIAESTWACPDPAALAGALGAGSALRRRLEELDPSARWLVLTLAAAGTPVATATLASAADRPEDTLLPILGALEERGLVSRAGLAWEPAHDELAALALEAVVPETLREVLGALGRALLSEVPTDPDVALRAAPLLSAAGEDDALDTVFRAWLGEARRRGDRRTPGAIAGELLGAQRSAQRVRDMVRALPLGIRTGLDIPGRRAAVGIPLLVVATGAAAVLLRPTPPPPDAAFVVATDEGARRGELRRETWDRPGDIPTKRTRLALSQDWLNVHDPRFPPAPVGRSWLTARVFPDSGGIDLVQLFTDGRPSRRLASAPGDDGGHNWAPDGSAVVFSTARWNRLSRYDLAILDMRTAVVRQLTAGDPRDMGPAWSPDGTRIAFGRLHYDDRPAEVCWIAVSGAIEQCQSVTELGVPDAGSVVEIAGWHDDRHVLVRLGDHREAWRLVDLVTGGASMVRTSALDGGAALSPDGRWVLGRGKLASDSGVQWLVVSVDRPTLARSIAGAAGARAVFWDAPAVTRPWLDTVSIAEPRGPIALNAPHRLAARGVDQFGRPVEARAISWRSLDTTVATVDSAGVVAPRRAGTVTVYASAGGWRADSAVIEIGAPRPKTVVEEDWESGIGSDWAPFGDPRPEVVREGAIAALWNHGDSSFESGVYSRRSFAGAEGLGVEARVAGRVTTVQWQAQAIGLDSRLDSARLADWDHRNGAWPGQTETASRVCTAGLPADEGARATGRLGFAAGTASHSIMAPADMPAGGWHRVRIQLFPDGRCGFAVDGVPVWISPEPVLFDAPFRILLQGRSHGTRMLVGPVEAWTGVKGDVDWRQLGEGRGERDAPPRE